jgi:hypothetical protein
MNRRTGLLLTLAAGTSLLAGVGRPAEAGPTPTCSFSAVVTLTPGISELPSAGRFATPTGQRGKYACHGPFGYGKGPSGSATATGKYGTADTDTCRGGGEGTGTLRLAGRSGDFTFDYGPFSGRVSSGTFDSEHLKGSFTITALEGDCLTAPVTRVRLEGEGRPKR